ncbi:MAG: hypothetical protein Fur0039_22880 [Rhodocyclaceae bacterium]
MRIAMRAAGALLAAGIAAPAAASVFGSLANFDVVNDTGKPAYGFEIEIDDSSFDHTRLPSIFGYNRVFPSVSSDPGAVVRFGKATVEDVPGFGVRIIYGGVIGSVFTPSGTYANPGESCWPGANPGWRANPCDHFGVSTLGQPAKTTYSWLVESSPGSGTLVKQPTGVPAVQFVYTPPVPAGGGAPAPAVVQAAIRAVAPPEQPERVDLWGEPFWVKTLKTKVDHNVDLGDLLRGDPDQEAVEVETEWSVFQKRPANHVADGPNEVKVAEDVLADADKAVIRRYEFYKYLGVRNPEDGEAWCDGAEAPGHACDSPFGDGSVAGIDDLGAYVGSQMAGFNVDALAAPVPEPRTWALMFAGLALMGWKLRRHSS